jgi:hypothetical protein
VDETKLSEDTGTQLTRSFVTELEAGAGSTTAASKASSRPDEHHQEEASLTHPTLNHHKNTTVLAHNTKNSTSSCIASHKNLQQNHDDGLKLKTKSRRRRTSVQQQVQEEKDKPGVEPGGEGKQEASHYHQQETAVDSNTFATQLQAPGRIDNLTAPHG